MQAELQTLVEAARSAVDKLESAVDSAAAAIQSSATSTLESIQSTYQTSVSQIQSGYQSTMDRVANAADRVGLKQSHAPLSKRLRLSRVRLIVCNSGALTLANTHAQAVMLAAQTHLPALCALGQTCQAYGSPCPEMPR